MSEKELPIEEVVAVVNTLGLKRAGEHFKVDPSTLYRKLKKHKFVSRRQYIKEVAAKK